MLQLIWLNDVHVQFLRAFAELQKATVGFVMTVHPSIHMEQLSSH